MTKESSRAICHNLNKILPEKHSVAAYYPMFQNEANILSIFEEEAFFLPRWSKDLMTFHRWKMGDALERSMPPALTPQGIPKIFLLPCVAINLKGFRIGRGAGCYDKTLPYYPKSLRIGIASRDQIIEVDFQESTDIPVDMIVTESKIHCCDG